MSQDAGHGEAWFGIPSFFGRKAVIFELTFAVAFCSIVYELAYAEMLRTFHGGTVTQYVLSVGLFMFGFGIGSSLYDYLDKERVTFSHVELALAAAGPLGIVWIIAINLTDPAFVVFGTPDPATDPMWLYNFLGNLPYLLSFAPAVTVGILSGLELPFLSDLAADEDDWEPPSWYTRPINAAIGALPFLRVPDDHERNAFSIVLGIDYFGSLAGTTVYALVLFPTIGLVPSVIVLGLINGLAAIAYHLKFVSSRPSGLRDFFTFQFTRPLRAVFLATLVLTGMWAGLAVNSAMVEDTASEAYLEGRLEMGWPAHDMQYEMQSSFTTKYQTVSMYERTWTGPEHAYWGPSDDRCLYLDGQVQVCESWAEGYHAGLVDVPMAFYEDPEELDVLVLGGGDWIAVNHLRQYGVDVDLVDIDGEFMNRTKNDPFLEQYHDNAYEYDRLDVHRGDAFKHLRNTDTEYDLILLDLPGARNDDMAKFYSEEFYTLLRQSLSDRGLVATWGYSRYGYSKHYQTYMNTVRAAGFESMYQYNGYEDVDRDVHGERVDHFYVFSPREGNRNPDFDRSKHPHVQQYRDEYESRQWRPVPRYEGIEVHSIFDPNYDVIIG